MEFVTLSNCYNTYRMAVCTLTLYTPCIILTSSDSTQEMHMKLFNIMRNICMIFNHFMCIFWLL
jgi:hypothetical protein